MIKGVCYNCFANNPTKQCGRCKTVQYCSVKCQTENWPKHKQSCKKKVSNKLCSCFNERDARVFARQGPEMCSYWECIDKPDLFHGLALASTFVTECTVNGGTHTIPTLYCSKECFEKALK